MDDAQVRLAVPAEPQYVRLVRLTAAGFASRLGFSYDEVEDLRIAVDELCYMLVGPVGRQGKITLTFAAEDGGIVVRGEGQERTGPPEFAELSEQILRAIVDEYDVTTHDGTASFRMVSRRHDG